MPQAVLYYFPVKALGESVRLLLAFGGQEFEDRRITEDEWDVLKPTMPFGQMPVLELDGKQYAQSLAIARYLGHKYGVAGKDAEEDFEIDQNVDLYYSDLRIKATDVFHEPDEDVKEKMHANNEKYYYPMMLKRLDEIITQNNGHLACGRLTWADFVFAGMYDCLKMLLRMPDLDEKYPSFKKVQDTVLSIPNIRAFCDKAPKVDW